MKIKEIKIILLFGNGNRLKREIIEKDIKNFNKNSKERYVFPLIYEEISEYIKKNLKKITYIHEALLINNLIKERIYAGISSNLVHNIESSSTAAEFLISRNKINDFRNWKASNFYIVPWKERPNKNETYSLIYDEKINNEVGFVIQEEIYGLNGILSSIKKENRFFKDEVLKNTHTSSRDNIFFSTNYEANEKNYIYQKKLTKSLIHLIKNDNTWNKIINFSDGNFIFHDDKRYENLAHEINTHIFNEELELDEKIIKSFIKLLFTFLEEKDKTEVSILIDENCFSINRNIQKHMILSKEKLNFSYKKVLSKNKKGKERNLFKLDEKKFGEENIKVAKKIIDEIGKRHNIENGIYSYIGKKYIPVKEENYSNDGIVCLINKHLNNKSIYYLKMDIKKFFENINHEILMDEIKKIKNLEIKEIELIEKFIYDSRKMINQKKSRTGIMQGIFLSPALSNIYLREFDLFMQGKNAVFFEKNNDLNGEIVSFTNEIKPFIKDIVYTRYSDDIIISTNSHNIYNSFAKIEYLIFRFLLLIFKLNLNLEKTDKISLLEKRYVKILGINISTTSKRDKLLVKPSRKLIANIAQKEKNLKKYTDAELENKQNELGGLIAYKNKINSFKEINLQKEEKEKESKIFNYSNMVSLYESSILHLTKNRNSIYDYSAKFKIYEKRTETTIFIEIRPSKNSPKLNFSILNKKNEYLSDKKIFENLKGAIKKDGNKYNIEVSEIHSIKNELMLKNILNYKYISHFKSHKTSEVFIINMIINLKWKEEYVENYKKFFSESQNSFKKRCFTEKGQIDWNKTLDEKDV